VGQKHWIFI